jgi:4-hydroxybenzoate polyprenyltransferase
MLSALVSARACHGSALDDRPLAVDLDGTLIRVDSLEENLFRVVLANPFEIVRVIRWLMRGKARLKREISRRADFDPALVPYSEPFLSWLKDEHQRGRRLFLATGSDLRTAQAVADHLGIFSGVLASDGVNNLTGERKADRLATHFGDEPFVYAGNDPVDEAVWCRADGAIVVNASRATLRLAERATRVAATYEPARSRLSAWLRAMRPHQWVKNLLIFVPLIASHRVFESSLIVAACVMFAVFCLCASAIYMINDLVDLDADRRHATKRRRPFAAGDLSISQGVLAAAGLLAAGLALSTWFGAVGVAFAATYVIMTFAYSLYFKRRLALDVFVLASLYVIRIVAGGAALHIPLSNWLLGFCGFFFLSLSFAKRFLELRRGLERGIASAPGRAYLTVDREIVAMHGIGVGLAASVLLTLYISSDTVKALYRGPEFLWAWIPLLLYWQCRLWTIAARGHMHDDPVMFAVRDKVTYAIAIAFLIILTLAAGCETSSLFAGARAVP